MVLEWYSNQFPQHSPIPRGHVMRVKKALQGHPESARLWDILIDHVIRDNYSDVLTKAMGKIIFAATWTISWEALNWNMLT